MISINHNSKFSMLLLATIIVIATQLTDVKLGPIKIGELIGICLIPSIISYKFHKRFLAIFFFITMLFILGIIKSFFTDFYPAGDFGILKYPFVISISRYVEYLTCFSIIAFMVKHITSIKKLNECLGYFFLFNAFFSILFIFFYPLGEQFNIYYGTTHRLQGFYNEGGPLGLYYAFTAMLCAIFSFGKRRIFYMGIYGITIYLAQSKAATIALLSFFLISYFIKLKNKLYKTIFLTIATILFISVTPIIISNYIEDIANIRVSIASRPTDLNLVAGRISGLFISSNMIKENPFFGIGIGNYSLTRNNPIYLDVFPPLVDIWDLPGLGGIHGILLDSGIIGLLIYGLMIHILFRKSKNINHLSYLKVIFLLPFIFGAQLHFHYPWIALGIAEILILKHAFKLESRIQA